jgi:hypothetical protein
VRIGVQKILGTGARWARRKDQHWLAKHLGGERAPGTPGAIGYGTGPRDFLLFMLPLPCSWRSTGPPNAVAWVAA